MKAMAGILLMAAGLMIMVMPAFADPLTKRENIISKTACNTPVCILVGLSIIAFGNFLLP